MNNPIPSPTFNFDTPKGIRAVADHFDALADDPSMSSSNWREMYRVGHLSIYKTPYAFRRAAELLRRKCRAERSSSKMETGVFEMDAVRHYGSPEAGLAAIRRQLDIQSADMDPADVKRCERAALIIERYIEARAREAEIEAEYVALRTRIAAGTQPGIMDITPDGTEVHLTHGYRNYLGTVSACKIGPHPILGAKHPVALYTINVSHIQETRGKRYAFYPTKPRTITKAIWKAITII